MGRGQACDLVADDPVVQGRVLSMVPRHLLDGMEGIAGLAALEPILKFFSRHFSSSEPIAIDEDEETGEVEAGGPIGVRERALKCLDDRWGTPEERALLFCALCRSLGIRCRIVHCLLPASSSSPNRALRAAKFAPVGPCSSSSVIPLIPRNLHLRQPQLTLRKRETCLRAVLE